MLHYSLVHLDIAFTVIIASRDGVAVSLYMQVCGFEVRLSDTQGGGQVAGR